MPRLKNGTFRPFSACFRPQMAVPDPPPGSFFPGGREAWARIGRYGKKGKKGNNGAERSPRLGIMLGVQTRWRFCPIPAHNTTHCGSVGQPGAANALEETTAMSAFLTICPGCHSYVRKQSQFCPHCGRPIYRGFFGRGAVERVLNFGVLILLALILLLLINGGCALAA